MMGAEIDCFDGERPPQGSRAIESYVELKTYKPPMNSRQMNMLLRFKYPRWWVQSWLAGVPRIALGERDEQGTLHAVEVRKERRERGGSVSALSFSLTIQTREDHTLSSPCCLSSPLIPKYQ